MNLPDGKKILWSGYRYPPKGHSPCTDDKIIDFIEAKPVFKSGHIWIDKAPEDIVINPQAVPDDCEAVILEKAARRLIELGVNVNPKLIMDAEEEVEEPEVVEIPEEPPQLPIKSLISSYKRAELEDLIERFGWDMDVPNLNVTELKAAVRAKIEELGA